MAEISKNEEVVPDNAPWKLDWKTVAKLSGTYQEPVQDTESYVTQVKAESIKPWLVNWNTYVKENPPKPKLKEIIPDYQGVNDLEFSSVLANLVKAESKGRHRDKEGNLTSSPVGAKGITQVMSKTGENPGYGVAPLKDDSEEEYLRFGGDYLKAMLKEFGGDYRKALAAYNYGPGAVRKALTAAAKSGRDWLSHTPNETKDYVAKILGGSNAKKR